MVWKEALRNMPNLFFVVKYLVNKVFIHLITGLDGAVTPKRPWPSGMSKASRKASVIVALWSASGMLRASEVLFIMTEKELSTLVNEIKQIESERVRLDDRAAYIGIRIMDAYPVDKDRPELVEKLLKDIDGLL